MIEPKLFISFGNLWFSLNISQIFFCVLCWVFGLFIFFSNININSNIKFTAYPWRSVFEHACMHFLEQNYWIRRLRTLKACATSCQIVFREIAALFIPTGICSMPVPQILTYTQGCHFCHVCQFSKLRMIIYFFYLFHKPYGLYLTIFPLLKILS